MTVAKKLVSAIRDVDTVRRTGKVVQFSGQALESIGPDVFIGEVCEIVPVSGGVTKYAEVVGFRNGNVLLLPWGSMMGLQVGSAVIASGKPAMVRVGDSLLGRVIDGLGEPLDGKGPIVTETNYKVLPDPGNPLKRQRIDEQVFTGVRAIDGFLPLGKGQRMGIFAGSGVGKSTLLSHMLSASSAQINVVALIGERGREVVEFVEQLLDQRALSRTVVVAAGADQSALVRVNAAYTAMAIAEYFSDRGKDVLITMDSVTRFAMAQREVGLSIGEPPTTRGYTPSSFDRIARLMERAGNYKEKGSITGLFTVLVEGDDFNEPVSDHVRAILDGHIILDRSLANAAIFPAIDLLQSTSRLIKDLLPESLRKQVSEAITLLALYESSRDMIDLGGYSEGKNPMLDRAIAFKAAFDKFRVQSAPDKNSMAAVKRFLDEAL